MGKEAAWRKDIKKLRQELDTPPLRWEIDGVTVTATGIPDMTEGEARQYVAHVLERIPDPVTWIDIKPARGGKVELQYECRPVKFERIRRVTGYLVGSLDRWNDAKKAEERDRVKHD